MGAPLIGWLPGPGPLIVMPIGLALILKNSTWAKRRYAKLTKQHPEYGRWVNWAMGRSRAKVRPPLPDFKRDIMYIFRRDDLGQPLP